MADGLFYGNPLPNRTEQQPEQVEAQELEQGECCEFDPDKKAPPLDDEKPAEDVKQGNDEEGDGRFDGAAFFLFGGEKEKVAGDHDEKAHGPEVRQGGFEEAVTAFRGGEKGCIAEVVALHRLVGETDLAEKEDHAAGEQQRAEEGKPGDGVAVALVHQFRSLFCGTKR